MDMDKKRWILDIAAWTAGLLAIVLLVMDATAKEPRGPAPTNAAWSAECGSCHVAYPPALLPAQSWRAVMAGLDRHFGSDASLDPKPRAEIEAFLLKNAGRDRSSSDSAPLRITATAWFKHEHGVMPASSKAKGWPDCAACHRGFGVAAGDARISR